DPAREALRARSLIGIQKTTQRPKRPRPPKEKREREPAPRGARASRLSMLSFDVAPRRLEEHAVLHPGGARGLTGEAAEAVAHLPGKLMGHVERAIGDRAHERNPPARAVALPFRRDVRRTRRQTHPAVHALLQERVIESAEGRHRQIQPGSTGSTGSAGSAGSLVLRVSAVLVEPCYSRTFPG